MKELKPCPFCGSEAEITDHGGFFTVGCTNLGCAVTIDLLEPSEEAAAADWNRRAAPENKPLTLEQLESVIRTRPKDWLWLEDLTDSENSTYQRNDKTYRWSNITNYGKTWLAYAHRKDS